MYDLIIIGAGLAGSTAAIAADHEGIKTLVVTKTLLEFYTEDELGFINLRQIEEKIKLVIKNSRCVSFKNKSEAMGLDKQIVSFAVEQKNGQVDYAKNVLITIGGGPVDFETLTQKTIGGKIKVDADQKTSVPGIWAAGEVCNAEPKTSLVYAGEAVKAVLGVKLEKNKQTLTKPLT
ncbi:MAG: FAD-dependent oxidoreductase [Candidatus Doudnabacteria bacterium]|nr:FAD-dependent oxidoreductase [Candidatus Doudnabacteria bacterium]